MTAPMVKAVCDQCNGRGYMRGLGVGSPDSIYACRECLGMGWRWVRVWTDDDAQNRREWVEKHLSHLVEGGR